MNTMLTLAAAPLLADDDIRVFPLSPAYSDIAAPYSVIPAQAGIHLFSKLTDEVDPRLRGGDEEQYQSVRGLKMRESVSLAREEAVAIGRLATEALTLEAALHPKPGLVGPVDSGAHDDMDYGTFQRSIAALADYFPAIAAAGAAGRGFDALKRLGVDAERRMLAATGGVNTHRGAVFSLGLLAAAAGWRRAQDLPINGPDLGDTVAMLWGDAILAAAAQAPDSHGGRVVRRYGAAGAREEAAAGFPTLFRVAVPALTAAAARFATAKALTQTLFAIMAELEDTNLLHRGGPAGLAFAQAGARAFLAAGGVAAPDWSERALALHRAFIVRRLSPGGAADMLAAAWLVYRLSRE